MIHWHCMILIKHATSCKSYYLMHIHERDFLLFRALDAEFVTDTSYPDHCLLPIHKIVSSGDSIMLR